MARRKSNKKRRCPLFGGKGDLVPERWRREFQTRSRGVVGGLAEVCRGCKHHEDEEAA